MNFFVLHKCFKPIHCSEPEKIASNGKRCSKAPDHNRDRPNWFALAAAATYFSKWIFNFTHDGRRVYKRIWNCKHEKAQGFIYSNINFVQFGFNARKVCLTDACIQLSYSFKILTVTFYYLQYNAGQSRIINACKIVLLFLIYSEHFITCI